MEDVVRGDLAGQPACDHGLGDTSAVDGHDHACGVSHDHSDIGAGLGDGPLAGNVFSLDPRLHIEVVDLHELVEVLAEGTVGELGGESHPHVGLSGLGHDPSVSSGCDASEEHLDDGIEVAVRLGGNGRVLVLVTGKTQTLCDTGSGAVGTDDGLELDIADGGLGDAVLESFETAGFDEFGTCRYGLPRQVLVEAVAVGGVTGEGELPGTGLGIDETDGLHVADHQRRGDLE